MTKNKDTSESKKKFSKLEIEYKKSLEEIEEYKNLHKRAVADYQNLLKRTEKDKSRLIQTANEDLIVELLDVVDALIESDKHIDDEGLKNVSIKLQEILKNKGLKKIDSEKSEFNPELHEAIETREGKDGIILEVYREGYILNNKVIRPALVCVGSKNS